MPIFTDSLRGYAAEVLKRDGYKCRYCGLDGKRSFDAWLALSWDHLLPKGDPNRDILDFIVAACNFCNTADNRYFDQAEKKSEVRRAFSTRARRTAPTVRRGGTKGIFRVLDEERCQCNLTLAPAEAPCLILCPVAARRRAKR
jgi:hypothetical protein